MTKSFEEKFALQIVCATDLIVTTGFGKLDGPLMHDSETLNSLHKCLKTCVKDLWTSRVKNNQIEGGA